MGLNWMMAVLGDTMLLQVPPKKRKLTNFSKKLKVV